MTDIEDKIRNLGRLAIEQLTRLEQLDPHNTAQMQQFEENSALALKLMGELATDLKLGEAETKDSYAFFCQITIWAAENGSDAGKDLENCLPKMAALQGYV